MQDIIRGLTTGPLLERVVTFGFLLASVGAVYLGLAGILKMIGRGKFGPVEIETKPDPGVLDSIQPRPEDPPPVEVRVSGHRKSILDHKLFLSEAEFINSVRGIDDGSNKAAVAVAFLQDCKFASVYRHMKKFAVNIETSEGEELKNFPIVLNHIIQDYSVLSRTLEIRVGSRILCGVPQSWNRKFDKWHNPHVDMLLVGIREVLTDDYYYDWWSTATACFDLLHTVLVLTMEDAHRALLDINGELDREIDQMLCRDD